MTGLMLALIVVFSSGPASNDSERASSLGARIQPGAVATSTAVVFVGNGSGASASPATPVPTNVADAGVVVVVPPTATADTAPRNAAPAVAGAPVVLGLTEEGLTGPNVIRPGLQTWAFVSKAEVALQVGVFDAASDRSALTLDGDGLRASTGPIVGGGALNLPVELGPGDYWRATFSAEGGLLAVEPVTIVP